MPQEPVIPPGVFFYLREIAITGSLTADYARLSGLLLKNAAGVGNEVVNSTISYSGKARLGPLCLTDASGDLELRYKKAIKLLILNGVPDGI
jgi:hypothetical protein